MAPLQIINYEYEEIHELLRVWNQYRQYQRLFGDFLLEHKNQTNAIQSLCF